MKMNPCVFLSFATLLALCCPSFALPVGQYIEAHDINNNSLDLEPLSPVDPAVHPFPTVPAAPLLPFCMNEGYFRDPYNCRKFYSCAYTGAIPVAFYCQTGLIFNTVTNSCEHPNLVDC